VEIVNRLGLGNRTEEALQNARSKRGPWRSVGKKKKWCKKNILTTSLRAMALRGKGCMPTRDKRV